MAQDFANKERRARALRSEPRRIRRRDPAFHWGSFGAGIALGVAASLAAMLLRDQWPAATAVTPATPPPTQPAAEEPAPVTQFEFFDRLPKEKMLASPAPATTNAPNAPSAAAHDFLLQAASFTNKDDAERLRTTLAQAGWNATTATVTLSSGAIRHRVVVGPFATAQEAGHAIAELRKQDVDALVLARKAGG